MRRLLLATAIAVTVVACSSGDDPERATTTTSTVRSTTTKPSTTSTSDQTPTTAEPGGPVPKGFRPRSFTAISPTTWWVLGTAPCSDPPCTSLVGTTDGGKTFRGLPAPKAAFADEGPDLDAVSEIRFASADDGFAWGPGLWATHDGARTWTQVTRPTNASVQGLEAGAGRVWAIYGSCHDNAGCDDFQLRSGPADGDSFPPVTLPGSDPLPGDAAPPSLAVAGKTVWVQEFGPGHRLFRTTNGTDWVRGPGPCAPGLSGQLSGVGASVWAVCATGTQAGLHRSTDSGATFEGVPAPADGLPNSAVLGVGGRTLALVGAGDSLVRTGDAPSWVEVLDEGQVQFVGFTSPTVATAITAQGETFRLWRSSDGGRTWSAVVFA